MRILHAFLKFLVIALSGLCALERVHAQARLRQCHYGLP